MMMMMMVTMQRTLHLSDDIDRPYVYRKGGGRRFTCINDRVDGTIWEFNECAKKGQRKTNYRNQEQQCQQKDK